MILFHSSVQYMPSGGILLLMAFYLYIQKAENMFMFYSRGRGMNSPTTRTCADRQRFNHVSEASHPNLLIDSISFRYWNNLPAPLQAPALLAETHTQVYSFSFLSGEQIKFPLFQSQEDGHMCHFALPKLPLDSGGCSGKGRTHPL